MSGGYTFGDSAQASARLALLAEVFRETTQAFLRRLRHGCAEPRRARVAVDLGCGPGYTTALVRDTVAPDRLVAVDASAAFAREARSRLGSAAEIVEADAGDLPPRIDAADLIFARFLLTHLAAPVAAIEHWLGRLAPDGVLALEEVESIVTDEPTLARYLELQRGMLAANGNRLEVGPVIADAARRHATVLRSDVATLTPAPSAAARMFAMNFASWRARPVVAELAGPRELDELARRLDELSAAGDSGASDSGPSITWRLRQHGVVATR